MPYFGGKWKEKKYAVFEHVALNDSLSKNHPWRERDAAVGRENARWTMSKSGRPCPCQNVTHSGLPQKILEEDRCWILSRVPRRLNRSRNWTDLKNAILHTFVTMRCLATAFFSLFHSRSKAAIHWSKSLTASESCYWHADNSGMARRGFSVGATEWLKTTNCTTPP